MDPSAVWGAKKKYMYRQRDTYERGEEYPCFVFDDGHTSASHKDRRCDITTVSLLNLNYYTE